MEQALSRDLDDGMDDLELRGVLETMIKESWVSQNPSVKRVYLFFGYDEDLDMGDGMTLRVSQSPPTQPVAPVVKPQQVLESPAFYDPIVSAITFSVVCNTTDDSNLLCSNLQVQVSGSDFATTPWQMFEEEPSDDPLELRGPTSFQTAINLSSPGSIHQATGRAVIIGETVYYSPNSSKTPPMPPPVTDAYIRDPSKDSVEEFHSPRWWTADTGYLPFLPIMPNFNKPPFHLLFNTPVGIGPRRKRLVQMATIAAVFKHETWVAA
ncbi:hypothetical protein HYPSUDRAFT_207585 [Hypholoma sublateritium FD-334 SS-4]|uniref:Uncharacterized protein n=1 Tax=Hypholoma sublateritium (strain FD-334 SS-4) TaxID=945553 RepID=A0A0D2KMI1_HYPSF|nr:hypothetical protein HYPSUDRAFT_207585 [Hypholoma sublateritium FD-334 SS-4]